MCGLLLSGIGSLGLLFTTTEGGLFLTECFLFLIGSGVGLASPQLITAILLHTPQGRAGLAGGVLNAARQTGGALGVALLGIFMSQDHPTQLFNGLHITAVIAGAAFLAELLLCATSNESDDAVPRGYWLQPVPAGLR